MRIGIAGLGGIGSNVAAMLVRSGALWLRLVDFDRIEASNLNRQFYFADQIGQRKVDALAENLRRINPRLELECIDLRLDASNCAAIFSGCDLVVEGLDRQEEKKMLVESLNHGQRVVSACGIAGGALDGIRVRRLNHCLIAGDFASDCAHAPLFAHKVMAVAAHMTSLIVQQGEEYADSIC